MTSKKYLAIRNIGKTDPQVFTTLGVSSARDDDSKIGQFGSGSKHGILIALRTDTEIAITTGTTVITPLSDEDVINNKIYRRVHFHVTDANSGSDVIERSSMTLDFGSLDWNGAYMMLREFISNALDAVAGRWSDMSVFIAPGIPDPKVLASLSPEQTDNTTVYIELTPEVRAIFNEISNYFLHVSGKQNERIISKPQPCRMKMYRMGVFVSEHDGVPSLYDYNGDHEMKIDESRNMSSYNLRSAVSEIMDKADDATLLSCYKNIILYGMQHGECFEHQFNYWRLKKHLLVRALEEMYGKDTCYAANEFMAAALRRKGYTVVVFPTCLSSWYTAINEYNFSKCAERVLDANVVNMKQIQQVAKSARSTVDKVVDFLDREGFIHKSDKTFSVYTYQEVKIDNQSPLGYTDMKDIYLQAEQLNNVVTILEEVLHLYTGYRDETRDFQDLAFRIAGLMVERSFRTRKPRTTKKERTEHEMLVDGFVQVLETEQN